MRVFIFTYDRYSTISTPAYLAAAGIDHTVLCHTAYAAEQFAIAGRVEPSKLHVTNQPKGLANNRNAALDMMSKGEWAVFLVDDLRDVTEVADYDTRPQRELGITMQNQAELRPTLKQPVDADVFMRRCEQLVTACEAVDSRLGGFAGNDNPLFRNDHWKFNTLADGRCWVVQKSSLRFDPKAQMIDDVAWCAANMRKFGVVVVNQWVLPDCERFSAGAFGSIEQRMPQKLAEAAHLVQNYRGLVRYKAKAGWPPGSHVVLARTLNGVAREGLENAVLRATAPPADAPAPPTLPAAAS